jgi:hypothetical protein
MMIVTLKNVLRQQWSLTQELDQTPYAGGPEKNDKPLTSRQAEQLREELDKAIKRNKPILWILFALIVLLLLATVATAFANLGSSRGMDWVSATSGGILAFLIPSAMKVWREITRLEMMVAVATLVQGEALTALIRLLLEGMG